MHYNFFVSWGAQKTSVDRCIRDVSILEKGSSLSPDVFSLIRHFSSRSGGISTPTGISFGFFHLGVEKEATVR